MVETVAASHARREGALGSPDDLGARSVGAVLNRVCAAVALIGLVFALLCEGGAVDFSVTAGVLIAGVLVWSVFGRRELRRFPLFVGLFSFALCLVIIFVVQNPQVSDFKTQLDTARAFLAGDADAYHAEMYITWPDQVSYSLVEVLLLSLVDRIAFVKVFEAVCTAGIVVFSYYLIREAANARIAQCFSLLLVLFPTVSLAVGEANNQVLSALLCLAGMWVFVLVRKKSKSPMLLLAFYALCGIVIAFARFVRPDAVLALAAICLVALLCPPSAFERHSSDSPGLGRVLLQRVIGVLAIAVPYFLVGALISSCLAMAEVTSPEATGDRVVANKLVMGTNTETSGTWSADYIEHVEQVADDAGISYQEAAVVVIRDQLAMPNGVPELLVKKADVLWWWDANSFNLVDADPAVKTWMYRVDKAMVFLLIILCSISLARRLRDKGTPRDWFMLCASILALTIMAYCFIEVQPRYLYFAYIIMFPIAADGLACLLAKMQSLVAVRR